LVDIKLFLCYVPLGVVPGGILFELLGLGFLLFSLLLLVIAFDREHGDFYSLGIEFVLCYTFMLV
jgi:hypothetical protein